MSIKYSIKRVITKTGITMLRRRIMFKKYTQLLKLHGCYVVDIHQLHIEKGKLVSEGNDPSLTILLPQGSKSVDISACINHQNDDIEVYYHIDNDNGYFTPNVFLTIGKCNGHKFNKNIILNNGVRKIRLDLAKSPGVININNISIIPRLNSKINDNHCNNLSENFELNLPYMEKNNKKKKIVIVTHSMNETGAPILAYNIAKKFKTRKYDVVVIAISDGYLEDKYREIDVPVINLHQSLVSDRILEENQFDKIVKYLSDLGYSDVLTNTIISGITVPFFKKYNFNIVSLIHEMRNSIILHDMKAGGRDINFYSDKIVFPDEIVEREFYQLFQKNSNKSVICTQGLYKQSESIVPNYSKIYEKYSIPQGSRIILGSGVADFRKGIDLFLNAAQKLISIEGNEKYYFIWAGKITDKQLESWYKCQFERNGIKDRIHDIDFIKDDREYQNLVECSDAFWLTSREDPFPSVMIEALQYNTPVFAFKDCGGANTLLADGRGILIDNFDISELANKTKEVLNNTDLVKSIINKGKKYIKDNFVFDNYIDKLEAFFEDLKKDKTIVFADVTAIVPNYNYEGYLPMRLSSIINQTIKPKEIILLDDASSDKSIEISKRILENSKKQYGINYQIIKNTKNNGCFKQWIKGIKEASEKFVWIAEADDYAKNNYLETVLPAFADKNVVLSYSKSSVIDSFSNVIDYDYNSYISDLDDKKWCADFVQDGKEYIIRYLAQKNIIPNASSVVIRKSKAVGMEKWLSKYRVIGDWFAYIYLISKGKVAYSHYELNGHRRHSKSIIANQEKSSLFLKEMLEIKKYAFENFDFKEDCLINNALLATLNNNFNYELISSNKELNDLLNDVISIAKSKLKRSNILIILPDLCVGGGQNVGIRLSNAFLKHYNVFLVNARESFETAFVKNMIDDNVNILDYNDNVDLLRLYNLMLKFKSVISLIWWGDKLSYYAFGQISDVNRIISMHGCYENLLDNPDIDPYFSKNVEKILKTSKNIVYTADKNKRILRKYDLDTDPKVVKIDNGFVLEKHPKKSRSDLGINKDDFVFGLVARAIPEKGYEQAITAINIVNNKQSKKAHLILVGSGDYIEELKKKYQNNYIHFVDTFSEPLEWIGWEEIFDVGLLPTYFKSESLPTVIVEYLFLGKPVIATDIAEIKSMIDNNIEKAGLIINLVDGKPDIKELANCMLEIMNNKKMYKELKGNTKLFAKRFDMDKCIEQYVSLIENNSTGGK